MERIFFKTLNVQVQEIDCCEGQMAQLIFLGEVNSLPDSGLFSSVKQQMVSLSPFCFCQLEK